MIQRRQLLQLSACGLAVAGLAPGQAPAATISESFVFPHYLAALDRAIGANGRLADRLALDALRGITPASAGLISLPAPGVALFEPGLAVRMARLANDALAERIGAGGGRIAGLATIAVGSPDGAAEAERAQRLGFAGLSLAVNRGWRLDHPSLRPVLQYAAAAGMPIYLPASYAPAAGDAPYRARGEAGIIAGAATESAQHALQLIYGGVLDAHPGLQIVLSRLGQATPYWLGKLHDIEANLAPERRPARRVLAYFSGSIRLTTADMAADTHLYCHEVLGAGRLLRAV